MYSERRGDQQTARIKRRSATWKTCARSGTSRARQREVCLRGRPRCEVRGARSLARRRSAERAACRPAAIAGAGCVTRSTSKDEGTADGAGKDGNAADQRRAAPRRSDRLPRRRTERGVNTAREWKGAADAGLRGTFARPQTLSMRVRRRRRTRKLLTSRMRQRERKGDKAGGRR